MVRQQLTGRLLLMIKTIFIIFVRDTNQQMFHISFFDEDHPNPFPANISKHSPMDRLAALPYKKIDGCLCRETPREFIECYSDTCYKFPATLNITTPAFKMVQSKIEKIERDDLLLFSNIISLEIEYNIKLKKIEPGCFRYMENLISLFILSNYKLNHLDENVFEGLVKLQLLDLRKNGFSRITDVTTAVSAAYLPKLTLLELHDNVFRKIDKYAFRSMNNMSIESLNLIGCSIMYIHPECLAPLRTLKMLRLGRNFINISTFTDLLNTSIDLGIQLRSMNLYDIGLTGELPYEFLTVVDRSKMPFLYMAENHFDYVDDNSLPDMPYLIGLDLRSNLIMRISPNAFRRLPNLQTLLLACNRLTGVPQGTLLPSLIELDFSRNFGEEMESHCFDIPDYSFGNMTRLNILGLSGNNIAMLTKYSFCGLTNLTILRLQGCSLFYIEPGTFLHLKSLEYLNLKCNILLGKSLTSETFAGLRNLRKLEISGCALTNLTSSPNLFSYMSNLMYLFLNNNKIRVISPDQFQHLHKLRELHLYNNELAPWTESLLPSSSALSVFYIGENKLTYITKEMLQDWSTVNRLSLDGNPLSCDCSLYTMRSWIMQNNVSTKYMQGSNLTGLCVEPIARIDTTLRSFLQNATYFSEDCSIRFKIELLIPFVALMLSMIVIITFCFLFRWHIGYWRFLIRVKLYEYFLWKKEKQHKIGTYKYDAFVSYCKEDKDFVMRLVTMLENYEPYLKLCIYERDFQVGSNILETIFQSVLMSKRILLILSDTFVKSNWCRWETQLAEYHELFFYNESSEHVDDTLVMVKLQPLSKEYMTPTLKYLVKTRIYLEWEADPIKQKLFWTKLRRTLAASKPEYLVKTAV